MLRPLLSNITGTTARSVSAQVVWPQHSSWFMKSHLGIEASTASLSCAPYIQLPWFCPSNPSHGPVTPAASTCRCHRAANHKLLPAWRETPEVTSPEPHVGCTSCAMRKNGGLDANVHVPSPLLIIYTFVYVSLLIIMSYFVPYSDIWF